MSAEAAALRWHLTPAANADLGGESLGWLTDGERARLSTFAVDKRRRDWLLGRLCAKRLVRRLHVERFGTLVPPSAMEIASDPSGAPYARFAPEAEAVGPIVPGARLPLELALSHSSGWALAAAAWHGEEGVAIGADLETLERRSACFVSDFFAPEEQRLVERSRCPEVAASALWSAKEAVLKALHLGLSADTRDVVCSPEPGTFCGHVTYAWTRYEVELRGELAGRAVRVDGVWRRWGDFVMTLARLSPAGVVPHAGAAELHPEAA